MLEVLRTVFGALSIAGFVVYARSLLTDCVIVNNMVSPEGIAVGVPTRLGQPSNVAWQAVGIRCFWGCGLLYIALWGLGRARQRCNT